jgi:sugar lactone lactonase YvrE
VAQTSLGQVARVDPRTGEVRTFATGLPPTIWGYGSPVDVAFIGNTLYALTALESELFPNPYGLTGIYRMDGPDTFTVIVNIGEWSIEHPPESAFEDPPGAPFALQTYRGGFLVTEGHHNRVLQVTRDGTITELIAFDDIVPTGLDLWGDTIFMGEAGPVPHRPEDGKVVAFRPGSTTATEIASGVPLIVDVKFGAGRRLYALSNGVYSGNPEGSPGLPNTGSLVAVNEDGTFTTLVSGLNQPTSLEFIGNTAYIVTLTGEIWKVENL